MKEETVTIEQLKMYLYNQFQFEYKENNWDEVDIKGYTKEAQNWINTRVNETIDHIKKLY